MLKAGACLSPDIATVALLSQCRCYSLLQGMSMMEVNLLLTHKDCPWCTSFRKETQSFSIAKYVCSLLAMADVLAGNVISRALLPGLMSRIPFWKPSSVVSLERKKKVD